jgi:hypothetical protein
MLRSDTPIFHDLAVETLEDPPDIEFARFLRKRVDTVARVPLAIESGLRTFEKGWDRWRKSASEK